VASIKEYSKGSWSEKSGWRAIVHNSKFGVYTSKIFRTKGQAERWARDTEDAIVEGRYNDNPDANMLFKDIVKMYIKEVSETHKGGKDEAYRLNAMANRSIGKKVFSMVKPCDVRAYSKERQKQVKNDSVIRELNLISAIYNYARREWDMVIDNPADSTYVARPSAGKGRQRRLRDGEYDLLVDGLSSARNKKVLPFVLFAIETACRRSELLRLQWKDIDMKRSIFDIGDSKTGKSRSIPLSSRALAILDNLEKSSSGFVFDLTADQIKGVWKRACKRAGLKDLRLHDMRHEATSRFFDAGFDSIVVAGVTGHSDPRMLLRYTQAAAAKLAKKLG